MATSSLNPQGEFVMSDIVTKRVRSRMMRAVSQRDTEPELVVRRILTSLGLRYRVHGRGLPGSPDAANRKRGWAVFVNGCFWHGHRNCRKTKSGRKERVPASNGSYWGPKIAENRARDARKCRELRAMGFRVVIVWECELAHPDLLSQRLASRLCEHAASS